MFFFRNMPWMRGAKLSSPVETVSLAMCVEQSNTSFKLSWCYTLGKRIRPEFLSRRNLWGSGRVASIVAESPYHWGRPYRSPGENSVSSRTTSSHTVFEPCRGLVALDYLSSKTSIMTRWVKNYTERTGIRINLLFNLATQSDSRTNLEIARLSSRIAVSTQQDSSSMITCVDVFSPPPRICWIKRF